MAETTETFAQRLKRLRRERGFSTTVLAYKARVTEGAIRSHENGSTASVRFETGVRYAETWA